MKSLSRVLGLSTLLAFASHAALAQDVTFPFVIPWDDAAKTATDVSFLNPAPLTDQQRVVARDGHFFDQSGRRTRFLGVNFVFSTNFPEHDEAEAMAARLHKFGVNIVRLHHMDTLKAPNGIFPADSKDTQTLDAAQIERLDYLVAQLGKNGIYVDLNLLVGRRFNAADGFPDTWGLPNYGKIVSWFEPKMIEMQKQYAKALLDHVNPYTKLRWADDPVVALVEINNEDTLLGVNRAEQLRALPDFYRKPLEVGWNGFLKTKYGATDKMLAAWNVGATPYGDNQIANARFENEMTGWQLESAPGAAQTQLEDVTPGEKTPPGRALKLQIAQPGTDAVPLQVQFAGLSFKRGEVYRVQFWAKSSTDKRALNVNTRLSGAPYSGLGLVRGIQLSPQWTRYTFTFKAPANVKSGGKLAFTAIGGPVGDVWIADVQLQSGNAVELENGQSLETQNIELPLFSATGQGADLTAYLMEVEARYVETMRAYLKDDLGVKALVTCSQSGWGGLGGLARESKLDFVDMHAYWDLADSYDTKNWTIKNTPMVRQNDGATLSTLAMNRVAGKPYTVSEYNHSAPNEFQVETLPFLAGFAAWQDWDGIFLFDYHSDRRTLKGNDKISRWLDVDSNPAIMAYLPAAALLFLGGQMPPAPSQLTLDVPRAQVPELMAQTSAAIWALWNRNGVSNPAMLSHRDAVRLVDAPGEVKLQQGAPIDAKNAPFSWRADDKTTATLQLNAPGTRFLVGFPNPQWQSAPGWSVQSDAPFLAATLSSRDQKPIADSNSLLLTVASRFQNLNMNWNVARTSVGENWGEGPVQSVGVAASIGVKTNAHAATVFALNASGARGAVVPSQLKDGQLTFQIGPQFQTVWFEIATN